MQESAASRGLLQRTFERLPHPVDPRFIALNPTLELVAIATTEKQVDVFRFGGQRAFGVRSPRDRPNVSAICWKYDGTELAIIWSDNMFQSIRSSTGAVSTGMNFFGHGLHDSEMPTYVTWEPKIVDPTLRKRVASTKQHAMDPETPRSHRRGLAEGGDDDEDADEEDGPNPTVHELLSTASSEHSPKRHVNHLPKLLASFNVREELPRLSALPQVISHDFGPKTETVAELFARQDFVDHIINRVGSGATDTIDILAIVHEDKHMCLVQGSKRFGLCALDVPDEIHKDKKYKIAGLTSHAAASCMAILTESEPTEVAWSHPNSSFGIHFASFNVVDKSGHYLPIVLQAIAHLTIIEKYITFSIAAIRETWTAARDVFSKYMQSLEETLSQKDAADPTKIDIVTAMYRMAVTGSCNSDVEEWMKDIVGFKGLERWSNAFPSGMVNVINTIHGNLLPALDRLSLEAIRLRAICRKKEIPICQLSEETLTQLLDDLDILRLLSNAALLYARQEIPQIEAFVIFMKNQMQILKEPDSSSAKEAVEIIAALDYGQLLSFISGPMTRSYLNVFFGREAERISNAPRRPKQQAGRKIILSMLDRHSQTSIQPTTPVVEFINLLYQSYFISDTVRDIQKQAIDIFATGTLSANQIALDWDKMSDATDVRMTFRDSPFYDKLDMKIPIDYEDSMVTYVVAVPEENRNQLRVHRKIHKPSLGMTDVSPETVEASRIVYPASYRVLFKDCSILDVKFGSDETLVLLVIDEDKRSFIVQFPVFRFWDSANIFAWQARKESEPANTPVENLPPHEFVNFDSSFSSQSRAVEVKLSDLKQCVLHEFDPPIRATDFVPRYLHIRGPGRMSKHLLVLDEAKKSYFIFSVDGIEWRWH